MPCPNGHSVGFSLEQFSEVLKTRDAGGQPYVLIGGQAVNYWAERYLPIEPERVHKSEQSERKRERRLGAAVLLGGGLMICDGTLESRDTKRQSRCQPQVRAAR